MSELDSEGVANLSTALEKLEDTTIIIATPVELAGGFVQRIYGLDDRNERL